MDRVNYSRFSSSLSINQNLKNLTSNYRALFLTETETTITISSIRNVFEESFLYYLFDMVRFFKKEYEISQWYNEDNGRMEFLITKRHK